MMMIGPHHSNNNIINISNINSLTDGGEYSPPSLMLTVEAVQIARDAAMTSGQ